MKHGCPFGSHRVIEPAGALPQAAGRLNNNFDELYDNEILVDVETLNVDSASFTQMEEQAGGDERKIGQLILANVAERGKQQNPVTGSGGVLIGRIARIGPALQEKIAAAVGDTIVTLVSLTLTPLRIDAILKVRKDTDQVDVRGQAVLFERSVWARLPDDLPPKLVLAVLDVAGAAPQTARLVKPGHTVFILGAGGKSGMLCAYQARKNAGKTGVVIGTGHSPASTERIRRLGLCDHVIQVDATHPLEVAKAVGELTGGKMADVTINCVNIPDTEMASVMATGDRGVVYFFNMATSFTKAALGAEGIGHDVDMLVGNGYAHDHAEQSLAIIRESRMMRELFEKLFA